MNSRKITALLVVAVALLVIAGTKVSQLTRTRSLQSTSRFMVSTQDTTSGRWSSRYITAPDLATNISTWFPYGTNGGSGSVQSNGNQFAGVPLSIKTGSTETNKVFYSSTSSARPVTIYGLQGQDADLLRVNDYLGNILFGVNYDGSLFGEGATDSPRLTSTSTSGYVWTATGTDGKGYWAASSGSVDPTNAVLSNIIGTGAITNASPRDFYNANGILYSKNLSLNHRWVYYDDFNQPMTTPGVFPDSPTGHKYNVFTGGGGDTNKINLVDGKWWLGETGAVYKSVTFGTNGVYGSAAPINAWGGTFSYQRSTNNTPDGYEQNLFFILSPQVDFLPTNYLHITIGANIFRVQRELSATNIIYAQHFGGRYLAFDTNHSFTVTIISNNIICDIAGMRYVGYDESLSTTYGNIKVATWEAIGSPTNQFWGKWDSEYFGYAQNAEHWQYAGPFAVRSNGVLSRVTSTNFTLSVDDAYASGWNGSLDVPSKNAIYDKIETLGTGSSGGTSNSIPVVTITTNVNIGFGTMQSLAMTTPSNQFVNFQGTETNGDTVELAVTNSAATNITIAFNLDGTTSSYYDPTAGTNRSSFVVSPGGKILTFVYSTNWGAIWRLNAYLGQELELATAKGFGVALTAATNGGTVTLTATRTNAITYAPTNVTSLHIDWTGTEHVIVPNLLETNLVLIPTNMIVGREIYLTFLPGSVSYNISISNAAGTRVRWNISTNSGNAALNKTNVIQVEASLLYQTNGISAAVGRFIY